jgi:hypothetical protein
MARYSFSNSSRATPYLENGITTKSANQNLAANLLSANGGALVCNENLTLNGTLNVNGGLVNAKKNLTVAPGGGIAMPSANDVITVKGDFVVNTSANITLSNGLLDLKGDLVLNTAVWFATGANLHAQFSGTLGRQQIRYPAGGGASFGKLAVPGLDPRHHRPWRFPQHGECRRCPQHRGQRPGPLDRGEPDRGAGRRLRYRH